MNYSNVLSTIAILISVASFVLAYKKNKLEALTSFNSAHFEKSDIKKIDMSVSIIQRNDCSLKDFRRNLSIIQRDYYSILAQYDIKTKNNNQLNNVLNALSKKNISQDLLSKEREKAKKIIKKMYH